MNKPIHNGPRAKRDSFPRSERGVWGVRRSTPQLNDDPSPERYNHNKTGEDNGDAHHKRQVMGREVVVAITKGKLDFGPWELGELRPCSCREARATTPFGE